METPAVLSLSARKGFWSSISPQLRDTITSHVSNSELKQMSEQSNAPATFATLQSLALNFEKQGNYKAAEEVLQGIITSRQHEAESAQTLWAMHYLGLAQLNREEYSQSEQTYRGLIEIQERLNGKGDRSSWAAMSNLGVVLNKEGKYSEAEEIERQLLPMLQGYAGADHPKVLGCMRHLMEALAGQGKYEEAMEMNTKGMDLARNMSGDYQTSEIEAMNEMAERLERGSQGAV